MALFSNTKAGLATKFAAVVLVMLALAYASSLALAQDKTCGNVNSGDQSWAGQRL